MQKSLEAGFSLPVGWAAALPHGRVCGSTVGLVVCLLWMSPAGMVHVALRIGPEQSQTRVQGLADLSYKRTTEGLRGCCSGLAGGRG